MVDLHRERDGLPDVVEVGADQSVPVVIKMILSKLKIEKLTQGQSEKVFACGESLDLRGAPENNPENLEKIVRVLMELGLKPVDNDDATLFQRNLKEKAEALINKLVAGEREPTQNYKSWVRAYHVATTTDIDRGERHYKKTRLHRFLAGCEDLGAKAEDFGKGNLLTNLLWRSVRTRSNMAGIKRNIKRLNLEAYFTHSIRPNGTPEITERNNDIKGGFILNDLLRCKSSSDFLGKFNEEEAIRIAVEMVDKTHRKSGGGIGNLLANDLVMQVNGNAIVGSRVTLPDFEYGKHVKPDVQKAMDLTDLCFSVGSAAMQGGEEVNVRRAKAESYIRAIFNNYTDIAVIQKVYDLNREGVPKSNGHSRGRLGFDRVEDDEKSFEVIRGLVGEITKPKSSV